jgi:hypothetical protein
LWTQQHRRVLMVNFINILCAHFSYKSAFLQKSFCQSQNVTREKLRKALSNEKCVRKMMLKLTLWKREMQKVIQSWRGRKFDLTSFAN